MSKMNEAIQRAKEIREYYSWNYMEHLYEMMPKRKQLSEEDINDMEREQLVSLINRDVNVSKVAFNNDNYIPQMENHNYGN